MFNFYARHKLQFEEEKMRKLFMIFVMALLAERLVKTYM